VANGEHPFGMTDEEWLDYLDYIVEQSFHNPDAKGLNLSREMNRLKDSLGDLEEGINLTSGSEFDLSKKAVMESIDKLQKGAPGKGDKTSEHWKELFPERQGGREGWKSKLFLNKEDKAFREYANIRHATERYLDPDDLERTEKFTFLEENLSEKELETMTKIGGPGDGNKLVRDEKKNGRVFYRTEAEIFDTEEEYQAANKEHHANITKELYDKWGVTSIGETEEGVPIFFVEDVGKSSTTASAYTFYLNPGAEDEKPVIIMPDDRPSNKKAGDKVYRDMVLGHEAGHAVLRHGTDEEYPKEVVVEDKEGNKQTIKIKNWEDKPGELEADKFALDRFKEQLEQAGIEYTPELGATYLSQSYRKDFEGEVIENPASVLYKDRPDVIPSGKGVGGEGSPGLGGRETMGKKGWPKELPMTDNLGRVHLVKIDNEKDYWTARRAEANTQFKNNPLKYKDWANPKAKFPPTFQRNIGRAALSQGESLDSVNKANPKLNPNAYIKTSMDFINESESSQMLPMKPPDIQKYSTPEIGDIWDMLMEDPDAIDLLNKGGTEV
jgi:hypothetical protein